MRNYDLQTNELKINSKTKNALNKNFFFKWPSR